MNVPLKVYYQAMFAFRKCNGLRSMNFKGYEILNVDSSENTTIKNRPKISVVVCALNEEKNLSHVLSVIPTWVDELLLVDGRSTDKTVEVAQMLRSDIKILHQRKGGKGYALKMGIRQASGDIIVALDADGATDPREMYRFVDALMDGYDFAKGARLTCRWRLGMSTHRWLGNKILTLTTNILFGTKYTDVCSGYNAFWKKSLKNVSLRSDGFEMEQELNARIAKASLRIKEVPHAYKRRISGASKVRDVRQGLKDLLTIVLTRFT